MNSKIFLGKYRVVAEEMEAVGEIADSPLAYEAEEIDSGKKVVVEVVPAGSLKTAVRERLEAEAIAAKKLSHVNIPALRDFGVEDNHLVYVTDDFEGTLGEEWVNAYGPMPVGPVLRIASQVVSALTAAAFHRINHHAINPGNLVLVPGQTAEGEWPFVKVLHFVGVAPKLSGTDVAVAAFDKSLHYASPEQIQKGTVDFRSELYSLGSTMWFLLTGAPPLVAPAGPMAALPAKTGVAAEKIDAMPKNVRRLLAQMLAVNPEARPSDPLAFYQTLQDCLHQVERRETVARRFGIPSFSLTGVSRGRRIPAKALAFAMLFLAIATVAALVVSGYLRHGRIVRAEEPIGKLIGVPEASASVTPVTANTNAIASNTAPSTTAMAESNSALSALPPNAESPPANAPLPSTELVVSASNRQVEVTPAPPAASDSPKDLQSQEPASVMANSAAALPAVTGSREVASSKQPEPTPVESPDAEAGAVAQQTAPNRTIMREVRRAEPADDEPEARRAEPAPHEEGPESGPSETTAFESEPRVAEKSPAKKTERAAKPKRQAERKDYPRKRISESERAMPRLPAGARRARFVGVTPEGWWMLELPSNKIIVVPAPSSSP
jgi:eukaryotic-like serine/threonine-protein kinase